MICQYSKSQVKKYQCHRLNFFDKIEVQLNLPKPVSLLIGMA